MPYRSFDLASGSPAYPDATAAHDMHFDATGNLKMVDDAECVAQLVNQHLQFYAGEWFLDTDAGVPWFEFIYVEPFDQTTAESLLKEAILNVPGVTDILEFEVTIHVRDRGFHLTRVVVQTEYDTEVQI